MIEFKRLPVFTFIHLLERQVVAGETCQIFVPQQRWIAGIVFQGIRPRDIDVVEVFFEGRRIGEVRGGLDESGERMTAGEVLKMLNGLEGLHLTGGAFSLRFGPRLAEPGVANTGHCMEIRVGISKAAPLLDMTVIALEPLTGRVV